MSDNKLIAAIKGKGKSLEGEMSFFDHLEVLRWHLIRAAISIIIFGGLAFYFFDWIWGTIIMGPMNPGFFTYQAMCKMAQMMGGTGGCITAIPGRIVNNEMAGQFSLQINSSVLIGIILGFPYLLWEVWKFIKPALLDKERKAASGFVFYASLLFFLGILFGYFVVAPLSIHFLTNYQISDKIENMFTIDSYLTSVATLTLVSGIVFQLPIVIFILATIGIVTAKFMREKRRYAIIIILIIAMLVTPTPDVTTMIVISIPLFGLYEVSIRVAARIDKRRALKDAEFYGK